jgi:signal transduction histidine kinase
VPDAIFSVREDGMVLSANAAVTAIFGYLPDELVGRPLGLILPDYVLGARAVEQDGMRRDGQRVPLEVTLAPCLQENARTFAGIARDITERKQVEAERERLLQESQRANRVKDEFLATLSHELRTPLYVIAGHAELLTMETPGSPAFHESLAAVQKHAKIQTQLINDLLDVSRIVTGKMTLRIRPIELAPTLEQAVEAVRLAASAKDVAIDVALVAGLRVQGDPDRLQQVFWNLLSNAVKFTPAGGKVRLETRLDGDGVAVTVSDTGRGIAPEFLPHVLERFKQEDSSSTRAYGGLGLGLAIVRHLVEMHGATIEAQSRGVGEGATFTVRLLPAAAAVEPAPAPVAGAAAERAPLGIASLGDLGGKRVLIVDDEPDALRILEKALEKVGAVPLPASSARQALARIHSERVDLVLCDIGMPHEDGYEFVRAVRRSGHSIGSVPVLALTAYAGDKDKGRALEAGFDAHIGKPITPKALVRRLEAFLRERAPAP